ncbi:TPA: hypothetical protein ACHSTA_005923, partial [Pseudomonas aeruginosa]
PFLPFLSCLYGSERSVSASNSVLVFLSCLYGSELDPKTINLPSSKGSPGKTLFLQRSLTL